MAYIPITWTNASNYTASPLGKLIKSTNDGSWSETAKSTSSGTTISMKFVSTADHHICTGLSWYDGTGPNGSASNDNGGISFGIYATTTNAGNIIINGTPGTGYGNPLDEWEIILTPSSCQFKVAGTLVHTATTIPSNTYYGVTTAYNTNDGINSSSLDVGAAPTGARLPPPPIVLGGL